MFSLRLSRQFCGCRHFPWAAVESVASTFPGRNLICCTLSCRRHFGAFLFPLQFSRFSILFFSDSSAGSISFYSVAGVVREFSCNFFFNFAQVSHAKWHLMLLGYACIWASLSKCVCVYVCA